MSTTDVLKTQAGQNPSVVSVDPKFDWPTDAEIEALLPKVELVETDGQNMDSDLYRLCMELLLASIACYFRGRDDYYAAGNSFVYYSTEQARHREFKGPDFYLVKNVRREPIRPHWTVWEEGGRYPDVIIELLSPTTMKEDLTTKKDVYEKTFHTGNYFCFDPKTKQLYGWKLERSGYVELAAAANGRLWCDELELWLGVWEGTFNGYQEVWPRFFTLDGQLVPIDVEVAENARMEEQRRAEAAEAEVARLKAMLAEQSNSSS